MLTSITSKIFLKAIHNVLMVVRNVDRKHLQYKFKTFQTETVFKVT